MANLFDVGNAPDLEPSAIRVGSYLQWKRTDISDDYDPTLYNLVYVARRSGGTSDEITIAASEISGEYVVQVASAVTQNYVIGDYYWQAEIHRVSDSEVIVVDVGQFTIVPDLDVDLTDPRGHAEVMLTKVESLLEGRADKDVASYSIAGRSITKMSVSELLEWRNFYKREVSLNKRKNDIASGRQTNTTIKVRFPG